MRYRIGKCSDAKRIAQIQKKIKDVNDLGIFCHMSIGFLTIYYKLMIEDPESIFICAVDDNDKVIGYCFNILDAKKQNNNFNKKKYKLILASISSLLQSPRLLKELINRYKSLKSNDATYLHNEGTHGGYWGWDPESREPDNALFLHELSLLITKEMGAKSVAFEVDNANKKILKFHKYNGAIIEKEIILPDGRMRTFMKYDLLTHKYKM